MIEREAPGIAEAMRAASREHTAPVDGLARRRRRSAARTLIVNFPGSPKSIAEAGEGIREALPHAVKLLRGEPH